MTTSETFIACLDVGTTTIRCHVINKKCQIVSTATSSVELLYPKPGFVEIDPDSLWDQILDVLRKSIDGIPSNKENVKSIAISTQRSTFITWHRDTGQPFHNFITWKDLRSKDLCKTVNSSLVFNGIRWAAYCAYIATRNERYLTGSKLKIAPLHVTSRLLWVLEHNANLKVALEQNSAMFGTIDTWLLYKLTKGRLHVTDITNASATAFYDPFVLDWGSWAIHFLHIPAKILPKVVSNDFNFGTVHEDFLGLPVQIGSVMADQSSSMFGSGCYATDDLKITLGTGAFLDVNTAKNVHTSVSGIYPLVAWKIDEKVTFVGEVPCNDCGSLIEWLLSVGLVGTPEETAEIATSVKDNDGVYFVPAFSGLGPPINDTKAASGFFGLKPTTTKSHMVRAVLESIVYRVALAYQTLLKERAKEYKEVTVDGGVSKNNFICQLLSDLTGLAVERLDSSEMSSRGIGFVAGLKLGLWSRNELEKMRVVERVFKPNPDSIYRKSCAHNFEQWQGVVKRFGDWYSED